MDQVNIIKREFNKEQDQAFVYSSWRNSYYDLAIDPNMPSHRWYRKKTKEIREILKSAQVNIACFKDDPNTIAGYAISQGSNLVFIYVKIEFRDKGIGTLLFPKETKTIGPELTKLGKLLAEKKNLIIKGESNGNYIQRDYEDHTKKDPTKEADRA